MGYKVFDDKISFAEIELQETLEKTRSVQMMKLIWVMPANELLKWNISGWFFKKRR